MMARGNAVGQYRPGDRARLNRGTFLFQGIIVRGGAPVTVVVCEAGGGYSVEFRDAENQPHVLPGVAEAELSPLAPT